jgi:hypothetical protein
MCRGAVPGIKRQAMAHYSDLKVVALMKECSDQHTKLEEARTMIIHLIELMKIWKESRQHPSV